MKYKVINGDSAEVLKQYPDNYFDSVVTDPPYGIEFLSKAWDMNTGPIAVWTECLRVLKPGGHLLAFSAARTYHRLATNLEDVGFEIRDQIMWIYGSGFPKAQDIGKAIEKREGKRKSVKDPSKPSWNDAGLSGALAGNPELAPTWCNKCQKDGGFNKWKKCKGECPIRDIMLDKADNEYAGWKTALKPAHEPIVMCRKPFKGSCIDNVQEWGTGAMNIDASRVDYSDEADMKQTQKAWDNEGDSFGMKTSTLYQKGEAKESIKNIQEYKPDGRYPSNVMGEIADYQKYFYCPKVSRKERNVGCDMHEPIMGKTKTLYAENGNRMAVEFDKLTTKHNNHPTVKPVALMKYLVTLVTPPGGKVLDPFNGSGSTGMAVVEFGGEYTGIDLDPNYVEISTKRIAAWDKEVNQPTLPI